MLLVGAAQELQRELERVAGRRRTVRGLAVDDRARRGETEVESLTPVSVTARGETWKRTICQDSTLFLREIGGSSLVSAGYLTALGALAAAAAAFSAAGPLLKR